MKSKKINTDIYKRLCRAKEFIDDQFSEQINLNQIAKEACISPYHFLRVFHKVYNKTPHRYLTEKRIDKAKELLRNDSMSVTEVCFDVGFESLGSFSALFNKRVGLSPVLYRAETLRKILISINFPEKLVPGCFLLFPSF
jgi:AraC-like DNA-binding protein